MKRYKVWVESVISRTTYIDAEDIDEAWEKAFDLKEADLIESEIVEECIPEPYGIEEIIPEENNED